MRTKTFANAVFSLAALGLIINSACAPDSKRKTNVNRSAKGLHSNIHNAKAVTNQNGACGQSPDTTGDAKQLQDSINQILNSAVPAKFSDLPHGVYTLSEVTANFQAHNIPSASGASGEFDLSKKMTISDNNGDVTATCVAYVQGGQLQAGSADKGRSTKVDTSFIIDPQGNVQNAIEASVAIVAQPANITLIANQDAKTEIIKQQMQNMTEQQRRAIRQQLPKVTSAINDIRNAKQDASGKYATLDATMGGQFAGATATQTLWLQGNKLIVVIDYRESDATNPSRQVILTYTIAADAAAAKQPPTSTSSTGNSNTTTVAPSEAQQSATANGATANVPTQDAGANSNANIPQPGDQNFIGPVVPSNENAAPSMNEQNMNGNDAGAATPDNAAAAGNPAAY